LEAIHEEAKNWYAILTKPRCESVAAGHLSNKGIKHFYPKLLLPTPTRRGNQIVPLFPSYLFVHTDVFSSEFYQILWCRGVKRFVSFGDVPAVVDNDTVDLLIRSADGDGLIPARPKLKFGDQVTVADGPFKGILGIIQDPPDSRNRVRILMGILGRGVEVEMPAACLDISWDRCLDGAAS
jgi:transcriptional antiterminator RfaH